MYVPVHDRSWARGHSALACFANARRSFGGCSNRIALRIGRRALVAKGRRLGSCSSPGLPSITTSNHCSTSVLARSFLGLFLPRSFSIIVLSADIVTRRLSPGTAWLSREGPFTLGGTLPGTPHQDQRPARGRRPRSSLRLRLGRPRPRSRPLLHPVRPRPPRPRRRRQTFRRATLRPQPQMPPHRHHRLRKRRPGTLRRHHPHRPPLRHFRPRIPRPGE